jgi:hypothetical protein
MKPHPWLQPLYRRVLVTLFCVAWTIWEGIYDARSIWFLLMLGITAWAVWDFFLSGNYLRRSEESDKAGAGKE